MKIRVATNWTGAGAQAEVWDNAMKQWAAEHADTVELVREEVAGDDFRTKMTVDLAADNVADIMTNWPGAQTRPFVDAGVLLPAEDYFAMSDKVSADMWTDSAWTPINGVNYNLPIEGFKCFTFYNTTIFDKYGVTPPATQQELYDVAKVFNQNDIVPIDVGSKGGNPGHIFYTQILDQLPGGVDASPPITASYDMTDPVFTQAAEIVNEWKGQGVFPKDTIANGDWGPSIELYNQGKAAMLYTCPWMVPSILPEIAAVSELMYFPTVPGAALPGSEFNIGESNVGLILNKKSFEDPQKQALLVDLTDWILSSENLNAWVEGGTWPAFKVDANTLTLPELMTKTIDFTSTSPQTFPTWLGFLPSTSALNNGLAAMDKLFVGDDPAEVMRTLADEIAAEKP